jgi:hypothetical protein
VSDLGLREGGRYSVATEKGTGSKGVFMGYTMIGNESAIVLRLSDGVTRIIPVMKIAYIDVIEDTDRKKEERPEMYYG